VLGVAVIPICGTLVQKLGSLRPYSGMTGYDGIRQAFLTAMEDPDISGICLDIRPAARSPDVSIWLMSFTAPGEKAYPCHSDGKRLFRCVCHCQRSGPDFCSAHRRRGFCGVITMHLDWTQRIKDDGLKVTIITYGSRKAEGSPLRELSDEALAAIQQDINTMGELFVNTVARNRGISAKVIKSTQAACFMAADGVEIGLADEVCPPDAAFRNLLEKTGA
jgi:ClpP class serine protease